MNLSPLIVFNWFIFLLVTNINGQEFKDFLPQNFSKISKEIESNKQRSIFTRFLGSGKKNSEKNGYNYIAPRILTNETSNESVSQAHVANRLKSNCVDFY